MSKKRTYRKWDDVSGTESKSMSVPVGTVRIYCIESNLCWEGQGSLLGTGLYIKKSQMWLKHPVILFSYSINSRHGVWEILSDTGDISSAGTRSAFQ